MERAVSGRYRSHGLSRTREGSSRSIGISPKSKRVFELADGTEVTLETSVAQIEFMREIVGATVIFGSDDAEPLLGVTPLESVGIEVDPKNQRLKRLPAVRLKTMQS